jgi:HEAT repeat protein
VKTLLESLQDKDAQVRKEAAEGLAGHKHPSVVDALARALNDDSGRVQRAALTGLQKMADHSTVPALVKRLSADRWYPPPLFLGNDSRDNYDPAVRDAVLDLLTRLAPERVSETLQTALRSRTGVVKVWALRQLTTRKDKAAVGALAERVADDHWQSGPPILPAMDSRDNYDPAVRDAALKLLRELAPDKAAEALQTARKSTDASVRAWATRKLANPDQ